MAFENAKWIWLKNSPNPVNEYADFICDFILEESNATLNICAKTEYVAFLNGQFVGFNQYGDFPDLKAYDSYSLEDKLNFGKNRLAIIALSGNYDTSSKIKDGKGVIFEVVASDGVVCASSSKTLSRLSSLYRSGGEHMITGQLGMSIHCDVSADRFYQNDTDINFEESVVVDGGRNFFARPIKRLIFCEKRHFLPLSDKLYDGGSECVGYLFFKIKSKKRQTITISYGEHIVDGGVRRIIGERDFSMTFDLGEGENVFQDYFLRLGLRYLEIEGDDIDVEEIGVRLSDYPVTIVKRDNIPFDRRLYDVSVETLRHCMHVHYEDCPWREQAQYTMDSRTQILCGYYAFNETQFPSASLKLMSHWLTESGVFPITSPCNTELSISSFNLIYPQMLIEYYEKCGDKVLLEEVFENTEKVISHYVKKIRGNMLPHVKEWNFYEWEKGLDNDYGILNPVEKDQYDLPLNAHFIMALENFAKVCEILGKDGKEYCSLAEKVRLECRKTFFKDGLFYTYNDKNGCFHLSVYAQVFAILSGIATADMNARLVKAIIEEDGRLVPLTISNYVFKYEVLFKVGGYEDYILSDMQSKWGYMLEKGATTFWETIKGDADFDGAGSLCHGWSAVPIYVAMMMEKLK